MLTFSIKYENKNKNDVAAMHSVFVTITSQCTIFLLNVHCAMFSFVFARNFKGKIEHLTNLKYNFENRLRLLMRV